MFLFCIALMGVMQGFTREFELCFQIYAGLTRGARYRACRVFEFLDWFGCSG